MEHSILLEKLSNHGIRGTANRLLTSYLNNRKHCTKINKKLSTYKECKHGVPQGSVLGPLLFLVYINDLHKSIINSKTYHFADDTSIVCRGTSLKDLKLLLQNDLFGLVHWLRANKISLNAGKTEIIIFRSRYKRIDCKLVFKMSGQKLSIKKKVKYLGIILDEHLTWSEQMIVLLSKLSRATGILAKIRHFVNFKTRLSIYYCLFESHLNYCIQCFGYLTLTNLSKLQVLQNKAMRMIFFKGPRESARPLYLQAKILPVDKLLILKNCLFAFDHQNKKLPTFFDSFCTPVAEEHVIGTRDSKNHKLAVKMTETVTYGSCNIKNTVAKHWNSVIPSIKVDIKDVSKDTFKDHVKSYIIDKMA